MKQEYGLLLINKEKFAVNSGTRDKHTKQVLPPLTAAIHKFTRQVWPDDEVNVKALSVYR